MPVRPVRGLLGNRIERYWCSNQFVSDPGKTRERGHCPENEVREIIALGSFVGASPYPPCEARRRPQRQLKLHICAKPSANLILNTLKVLGLDVCKNRVVGCLLLEMPDNPQRFYRSGEFFTLTNDRRGLDLLEAIGPTVALLEPTGIHYAKFWLHHLRVRGVEIRMVHNSRLPSFRSELGLPDKDDEADALALACYYFVHHANPQKFLDIRDATTARIRELSLELAHLNRVQSPLINKLRQRLAWQWPEVAHREIKRRSDVPPLLLGFIAGERKSARLDRELAATTGTGLDENTKFSASMLTAIHWQEMSIERELRSLCHEPQYAPYLRAFKRFGFGERVSAIVLAQIFPIERFFGPDGKPEVYRKKCRKSGKISTHHLSLRRFKKILGGSPVRDWSGDKKQSKKSGSGMCRTTMWQWVFCRIEVKRSRTVKSEEFKRLCNYYDELRRSRLSGPQTRMKVVSKAIDLLFRAICEELRALEIETPSTRDRDSEP